LGRSAINDAAAQVLRGTNGLINHLWEKRRQIPHSRLFVPVVFTTAEIWTSATDLRDSEIKSGRVTVEAATRQPWVWFTHNQSPDLRHKVDREDETADLSLSLRDEFARSIAIVGVDGIDAFLGTYPDAWF
jgi:hypothetical protein